MLEAFLFLFLQGVSDLLPCQDERSYLVDTYQLPYHRNHRKVKWEAAYKAIRSNLLLNAGIESKYVCQVII